MQLKEMIKHVKREMNYTVKADDAKTVGDQVVAALRRLERLEKAGQAMRDAFQVDYYAGSTAFIDTMDKDKLLEAGQAWDTATAKGEE